MRASAEKWRTGLAALVALVTGALLFKGPESAAELTTGWRTLLTLLAGGGMAVAIYGLWRALKAAAGVPQLHQFDEVVTSHGSVLGYELAQAKAASDDLRGARQALMVALPLLGAALIAWWWAGTKDPSPPAFIEVERPAPAKPICGTLKSGDNGHLRIQVSGKEKPDTVPLSDVQNVRLKASC